MKVLGIIAEYNPFHNGHKYQIQKARELTGADFVVVIMSGNFVQRGAPAILNKHIRTEMAIDCGVDLVIELPLLYSCASAEFFAHGAIDILNKLGIIDYLSFGAENDDIEMLLKIASVLANEPKAYSCSLKNNLKSGKSFPAARSIALKEYFNSDDSLTELLSSPNNILAIEYLKALIKTNSKIKPVIVKRAFTSYHDKTIDNSSFASATAIREYISNNNFSKIEDALPNCSLNILKSHADECIFENAFSTILGQKLNTLSKNELTKYSDVTCDLSDRICNLKNNYISFEQFRDLMISRNFTGTRISRVFMNIILEIKKDYFINDYSNNYARLLGFNKKASVILRDIKQNGTIPLVSKLADASLVLTNASLKNLELTLKADNIYRLLVMNQTKQYIKNEFEYPIIINS